jgi:hypothetical protein
LKKRKPYNPLPNNGKLKASDIDNLWNEMKQVLDTEMPEQQERRRFFAWLFTSKVLFTFSCIAAFTAMFVHIKNTDGHHAVQITLPIHDNTSTTSIQHNKENNKEAQSIKKPDETVQYNKKVNSNINPVEDSMKPFIKLTGKDTDIPQLKISKGVKLKPAKIDNTSLVGVKTRKVKLSTGISSKPVHESQHQNLPMFAEYDFRKKHEVQSIQATGFTHPDYHSITVGEHYLVNVSPVMSANMKRIKGFTAGVSLSMNIPVSRQEMSRTSMNGEDGAVLDYLPSVYAQYHFNNKFSVEGEFQFVSPQYTAQQTLSSKWSDVTTSHYKEHLISLNKLYYLNIPFSVKYSPITNFTFGTGIQFSKLKRSVFTEEDCTWDKDPSGWKMTSSTKTTKVKSVNENKGKGNNNGNGNGGGNGGGPTGSNPVTSLTRLDTIAQSFRKTDWRWMVEVNYQYHRLNTGVRFNMGLDKYINAHSGNIAYNIPDRNKSFMLYLRFDIIDTRKKSK